MPAGIDHAATTQSMDTPRDAPRRLLDESDPPESAPSTSKLFSHADDAVVAKDVDTLQRPDRQIRTLDYSLRSLLAGGIAGCAVRHARVLSACR